MCIDGGGNNFSALKNRIVRGGLAQDWPLLAMYAPDMSQSRVLSLSGVHSLTSHGVVCLLTVALTKLEFTLTHKYVEVE
jgi:hypothetical protein